MDKERWVSLMSGSDSRLISAALKQVEDLARGSVGGRSAALKGVSERAREEMSSARHLGAGLRNYQLLRELQRGGQGVVYEGRQRGTNRRVAIKVIRDGPLASSGDRTRFEREVQILGALQHPSIVTILESGRAGGCDFFVMQFVDGSDLEAFVEQLRRSAGEGVGNSAGRGLVRRVVDLLARTCEAVHAAHLAGVVHRDLKPTNVRIGVDEQPHILDFGLAKKLPTQEEPSVGEGEVTLTGEFVGTLPYASPEQAGGAAHVDTRTDVYSLGVLLYRLLTQRFPYETTGAISDIIDRIRSCPPQRPRELNSDIDSDLQTIVLRCLQKSRERRYETAGDLARDLRRWLANEPIDAKRDSAAYLLRMYVRRHRAAFGAGAMAAAVIVVALVTSLWFWSAAVRERDRALCAQESERRRSAELTTSLSAESTARDAAQRSAAESDAMRKFVLSLLESADPAVNQGRELRVREMLDKGAGELLAQHLKAQPALRATLLLTLGDAYQSLGENVAAEEYVDQGIALRSAALGERDVSTLRAQLQRVELLVSRGQFKQAESVLVTVGVGLRESGASDATLLPLYQMHRGIVLRELGRLSEADTALRASLEGYAVGGAAPRPMGVTLNALGVLRLRQQRYAEARAYFGTALIRVREAGGRAGRDVGAILNNQASCHYYLGDYEAADPIFLEAYEELRRLHGEDHPLTVTVANNRCALVRKLGRLDEAEAFGIQVVTRRRELLGALHPEVATSLTNLAMVYVDRSQHAEAERALREALDIRRECMPEGHPTVAEAERMLGASLVRQDRFSEAEPLLLSGLARIEHNQDVPKARRVRFLESLAELYELWGRDDEAFRWRDRLATAG